MSLINATPWAALSVPTMTAVGADLVVVISKATFFRRPAEAAMQQLLQVKPHEKHPPRSTLGVYEFDVDTPAPVAITEKNPQHGVSGATQFYVPTFKTAAVRVGERKLG